MQLTWRLVPLAMVFALGAFLLSSGAGPTSQPALADVDSISVNTVAGENEDYITVTVEAEDDSVDDLVISVASGQGTLTINDCEVDGDTIAEDDVCVDADGTEDDEVTITAADSEMLDDNTDSEALTVTLNLELDCRNGTIEVVTITADQGTSESITVVCGFDAPNITIEKEADGDNDTFDFDFDVSRGEDCAVFKHDVLVDEGGRGDFSLDDNEEVELYCDDDAVVEIVETDDGEFSEIEDDDDCRESDSWIEFDGASVTIDLDEADDDGTVTCNFRNEGGLTPTATSTPIGAGPPSTVTVSAAPDSIPDLRRLLVRHGGRQERQRRQRLRRHRRVDQRQPRQRQPEHDHDARRRRPRASTPPRPTRAERRRSRRPPARGPAATRSSCSV